MPVLFWRTPKQNLRVSFARLRRLQSLRSLAAFTRDLALQPFRKKHEPVYRQSYR
jgi:hypothetical protein